MHELLVPVPALCRKQKGRGDLAAWWQCNAGIAITIATYADATCFDRRAFLFLFPSIFQLLDTLQHALQCHLQHSFLIFITHHTMVSPSSYMHTQIHLTTNNSHTSSNHLIISHVGIILPPFEHTLVTDAASTFTIELQECRLHLSSSQAQTQIIRDESAKLFL